MILPKEVLLDILLHLRRCDLDWVMLANQALCRIVLANNEVLARRVVEKATIHGPIGDGQVSRLRLAFTDPKKIKRRAAVRTSDGHRMELIGTWEEQIKWVLKALRHAHVKLLVIGCTGCSPAEEVIISKKSAKLIASHATTICVEILELGSVNMQTLSLKQFSNALLSFQSLSTLTTKANYGPGRHFTDEFLRRAGQMGVNFTHELNARAKLSSLCIYILSLSIADDLFLSVTDEGVLDYLFNPAYPIRDRLLKIRWFRPSRKFLFKLFEKMHAVSAADIDDITFWACMQIRGQKLGKYKTQLEHATPNGVRITCLRFRNDDFCATISFDGPKGLMRKCRLTTVKDNYDKVFGFV